MRLPIDRDPFTVSPARLIVAAVAIGILQGCASGQASSVDQHESFDSTDTYSRAFAATDVKTCEAARRALLSQGYVILSATKEAVGGRKSFQPAPESHVEIEFHVTCAKEGYTGKRTIAFVNAVQDRFGLKKSNNSASVGVGAFGSLSLPFTGSDDSMVKVASATITTEKFYERFFSLVERYIAGDPGQPIEAAEEGPDPVATPAPPPTPAAVLTPIPAPPAVPTLDPAPLPVPVPLALPAPKPVPVPVAPSASAALSG
ncbi:MAG: hypothetical protein JWQ11_1599 [Rhizobacter sp.]|nr:hypothetical protein [Rhizobacter sp.]